MDKAMIRTHKNSSKKRKKTLEDVIKDINREYVRIKKRARKFNNELLFAVLDKLLSIMRSCDELFCSMKPRLDYLGSYFDGLRVGYPSEYDINVVLKMPVNYKKIELDAAMSSNTYTSIILPSEFRRLSKNPETASKGFLKTSMWCDTQYRLSVNKVRNWMQRVIDTALSTLPLLNGERIIYVNVNNYCFISTKIAGPANTITIIPGNNMNNVIDIDLVPTFQFILPKRPKNSQVLFKMAECTKKSQYFVVPKPSENYFSWRISFPIQERLFLSKKNNLKSTLKLIKLLRDVQGFKQLASYFIKTIFLWEAKIQYDNMRESKKVSGNPRKNKDFWAEKSLSYLLIYMLKKLRDCLEIGEINDFWCPGSNLIEDKIKIETCQNWSNRLSFIIKEIEEKGKHNPKILWQYFKR